MYKLFFSFLCSMSFLNLLYAMDESCASTVPNDFLVTIHGRPGWVGCKNQVPVSVLKPLAYFKNAFKYDTCEEYIFPADLEGDVIDLLVRLMKKRYASSGTAAECIQQIRSDLACYICEDAERLLLDAIKNEFRCSTRQSNKILSYGCAKCRSTDTASGSPAREDELKKRIMNVRDVAKMWGDAQVYQACSLYLGEDPNSTAVIQDKVPVRTFLQRTQELVAAHPYAALAGAGVPTAVLGGAVVWYYFFKK